MKQNIKLGHNIDLVLSDKFSEGIISCLELEMLNEKVEVLFKNVNKFE